MRFRACCVLLLMTMSLAAFAGEIPTPPLDENPGDILNPPAPVSTNGVIHNPPPVDPPDDESNGSVNAALVAQILYARPFAGSVEWWTDGDGGITVVFFD